MSEQRLFISHASEDATVVNRIVAYLEAQGVPCWVSSRDIPPRAIYADAITEAMQACSACAVMVSRDSNQSKAVKRELELASHYDKPFIPIRVDDSEPAAGVDYYLRNTQWMDYKRDGNAALDRIAAQVQGLPAPTPSARKSTPRAAIAVSAAIAAVVAWLVWYASTSDFGGAALPDAAVTELSGQYTWNGVACGEGPSVSMEDGNLIFTMPGTPTFRHRILRVRHNVQDYAVQIETRVISPAEQAGATYVISRKRNTSELDIVSDDGVNTWNYCAPPIAPDGGYSPHAANLLGQDRAARLGQRIYGGDADFALVLLNGETATLTGNRLVYIQEGERIEEEVLSRENYENGTVVRGRSIDFAVLRDGCTPFENDPHRDAVFIVLRGNHHETCGRGVD